MPLPNTGCRSIPRSPIPYDNAHESASRRLLIARDSDLPARGPLLDPTPLGRGKPPRLRPRKPPPDHSWADPADTGDEQGEDEDDTRFSDKPNAAETLQIPTATPLRDSPLAIVSLNRAQQFALIGSTPNPFPRATLWNDEVDEVGWQVCNLGGQCFAVESSLPGDPARAPSWGAATERLLWAIQTLVVTSKQSLVAPADRWLGEMVWGSGTWPRHWLGDLRRRLEGLISLHVVPHNHTRLRQQKTRLLSSVYHLGNREAERACGDSCPSLGTRHGHFVIQTGPEFLGILELLGNEIDGATRSYDFNSTPTPQRQESAGNGRG